MITASHNRYAHHGLLQLLAVEDEAGSGPYLRFALPVDEVVTDSRSVSRLAHIQGPARPDSAWHQMNRVVLARVS